MKKKTPLFFAVILLAAFSGCSDEQASPQKTENEKIETPTNPPVAEIDEETQKLVTQGKNLHLVILNRNKVHSFYQKPSIWGGIMDEPLSIICVPDFEWEKLEKEEKDLLKAYAASLVSTVKKAPFSYSNIPSNAPVASTIRKKVSAMNSKSWGIMIGGINGSDILSDTVVARGTEQD